MKNIHIVEKDNLQISGVSYYGKSSSQIEIEQFLMTRKIYITSDKEIKEGDWFIHTSQQIKKCESIVGKSIVIDNGKSSLWSDKSKKIILTTDQDLIKDGVQAINDEFLEWFVNNPSCEEVKIEDYGNLYNFRYLVLIPREETKTTNDVDIKQRSYSEEDVKKMLHTCCDVLENNKRSFWNTDGLVDEIVLTFKQQEQ
jgi:hypothetical protein